MPSGPVSGDDGANPAPLRGRRPGLAARVEDWLLVGWVALAAPLLSRTEGGAGPFDGGQPVQGGLRLLAVGLALAALVARRTAGPGATEPSILQRGAVGPLVGGLLLIAGGGWAALGGAPEAATTLLLGAAAAVAVAMRRLVPPLSVRTRRALVTPFILVAGGLFWQIIDAVVGGAGGAAFTVAAFSDRTTALAAGGFFILFSGVYYAMLVYAPRQVVEHEGGALAWLFRYATFAVGVVFGLGWLRAVGG